MKTLLKKIALFLVGISFAAVTHATVIMVTVTNYNFSPANFSANVGDTIMWMWSAGSHTTTSLTTPSGAASWNAPMNSTNTMYMYTITTPGTYTYWCSVHTTNMEGSFTATAVQGVQSISKTVSDYVSVYPNPSNSMVKIHLNVPTDNQELIISDMQGQEILRQNPASIDNTINISNWQKGMYFYTLTRKDQTLTGKFEVQ